MYSIGYIGTAEYDKSVPFASLVNKYGVVCNASSAEVVQAQYSGNFAPGELTASLVDTDNAMAYPICGYTYFVFYNQSNGDCMRKKRVLQYYQWTMYELAAIAKATYLSFTPLTAELRSRINDELSLVKCDGAPVISMLLAKHSIVLSGYG